MASRLCGQCGGGLEAVPIDGYDSLYIQEVCKECGKTMVIEEDDADDFVEKALENLEQASVILTRILEANGNPTIKKTIDVMHEAVMELNIELENRRRMARL